MKNSLLIIIAAAMIFAAGCKKDDVGSLKMVIEGVVTDSQTQAPLEGATVKLTTEGRTYSAKTNASGIYSLGAFPSGVYFLIISKSGYLTETDKVYSEYVSVTNNTDKVVFSTQTSLAPLNQSVTFTLHKYFYNNSNVYLAASNVDFTIDFDGYNQARTVSSDQNGLVTIDSLPYSSIVYFIFDFKEGGVHYKQKSSYYTSNSLSTLTVYGYEDDGDLGIVSSNLLDNNGVAVKDFPVADSITFTFTQPVDTASADFYVGGYSYGITWLQNNMKAVLDLTSDLGYNIDYYFYVSVENESGTKSLYNSFYFHTESN